MSEEHQENGNANGDVPEIELIIKVSEILQRRSIRNVKKKRERKKLSANLLCNIFSCNWHYFPY
jgi:hypothetical protein